MDHYQKCQSLNEKGLGGVKDKLFKNNIYEGVVTPALNSEMKIFFPPQFNQLLHLPMGNH